MTAAITDKLKHDLEHGPEHLFRDWPNTEVPRVAAGVYTVWNGRMLVYVGMAGRGMDAVTIASVRKGPKAKGLSSRLASHASGRRSGDQFCVYVCDRLVLPTLTPAELRAISDGFALLDEMTKKYIHANLAYRWAEVQDARTAFDAENAIKAGALLAGKPLLNPL